MLSNDSHGGGAASNARGVLLTRPAALPRTARNGLGGEAAIRFAVTWPELLAAAAPLSFADIRFSARVQSEGFPVLDRPYSAAAGVPFYFVNGGKDPIIPADAVHRTVAHMRESGIDVTWKELADNGHDTWTDAYSDPAFYDWLLSKSRP